MIAGLQDMRARLRRRSDALRARHPWLDHLRRAGDRYVEQRGNHFAAAITFFSLATSVPLLMIVFGAAGYALALQPAWFVDLEKAFIESVPPAAADAVLPIIEAAVAQRDAVAGIGLLAALWAGIWWMSNLREAVSAQWRLPPLGPTSASRVVLDLVALLGLGLALLLSVSGSVVAMGIAEGALRITGVAGGWARILLTSTGVFVGLAANWLVLFWITARLPRMKVAWAIAAKAALIGAVGIGILELSVTAFLGSITSTPGGAVFGSLLGVMLFLYLVSRFVLLVTAWAATAGPAPAPTTLPVAERPAPAPAPSSLPAGADPVLGTAALGAALGAGLLVGLGIGRHEVRSRRRNGGPGR